MNQHSIIRPWMIGISLPLLAFCAYIPVIRSGGFIWDDDTHTYQNKLMVLGRAGLEDIWLTVGATPQYYPLSYSSFWFERRLLGFRAKVFHFDNAVLHALSVLLLWRVLARLEVPAAWLAAAIFALHPMNVESVAWISERSNVLSCFLLLFFARAYIRFALPEQFHPDDALSEFESSAVYMWAFVVFCFALFAKTTACTAPAAMLLIIWWKRGRLRVQDWLRAAPFFIVAIFMGLISTYAQKGPYGARGAFTAVTRIDRIIIAGRALWFYAAKFFWPRDLAFVYPRWDVDARQWWQWAFPLTAIALATAALALRRRTGRGFPTALLYFGGMLLPALGFVNVSPMHFSYVADHFAYTAVISLAVIMAIAIARIFKYLEAIQFVVAAVVLFQLGRATLSQQGMYENEQLLWQRTIAINDRATPAYITLGGIDFVQRRFDDALPLFLRAVELAPDDAQARYSLGRVYVEKGQPALAAEQFRRAVELSPRFADAHQQLGEIQRLRGDDDAAVRSFRRAIFANPRSPDAYYELSQILDAQGNFDAALRLLETSSQISPSPLTHYNIAMLLMRHGQRERAADELREALRLQPEFEGARSALRQLETLPDSPPTPPFGPS